MSLDENNLDVFFNTELALVLKLEADGNEVQIKSGNIEKISLELHSYGFAGNIQFSGVDDDKLVALLDSKKPTKVTLTFQSTDPILAGATLVEIKGMVLRKYFRRVDKIEKINSFAVRHYEVVISDNAQATWSEHRPVNIYIDESMKDVIEAHKNPEISIKYDFSSIDKKHPITAFSLVPPHALPSSEQDNFYSFVQWYLHQEGGIWNYDYKTNSYSVLSKKPPLTGKAYKINEWWVAPPMGIYQKPPRFNVKTLKHTADSVDSEDKENDTAFKSVHHNVITPTNYRAFPEHAQETVHSMLDAQNPEVELEVIQLESDFHIDKLVPGSYVTFYMNGKMETWSSDSFYKGKTFRSRVLFFEATKLGLAEKLEKPTQTYRLYIKTILELEAETYIERPHFKPPTFPFSIQGKVSSDIGDEEQSTYKISENEHAPQGQYLVSVPLAENKNVVVPFTPDLMSGQFYYPFCKGERVLLSVYFHTAKIQRIIDWQPLARLPSGVQGNQIVLSSNGKDKYAFIRHEFEDGKNSVITIRQATSETQTQLVQIKDKDILITVDEKDKKTLTIHLSGEQGVMVSLEDKAGKMTQQIAFDGQQIVSTCKNSGDTSTYVQKPDSVTITCKQFNVKAEKINMEAQDVINQKGQSKVNIETAIANIKAGSIKLG
ncbi:MAG: hypothetical protein JSR58_02175 [Verrucomicrobia bacterium]|nr:hypothetical protein [Verrucomicrobiota bacterium]